MNGLQGTALFHGAASGETLCLHAPLSFYGGVNPLTGTIIQEGHPQKGHSMAGRLLVLPNSTGSTVGTYTLLRLRREGVAPVGIISQNADTVLTAGTILAAIPHLDKIPIKRIPADTTAHLDGAWVRWAAAPAHTQAQTRSFLQRGSAVKLGGSLVTHKGAREPSLNEATLNRVIDTLPRDGRPLLIVHGAGSFGHLPVHQGRLLERPLSPETALLWSEVQSLQYDLNSRVAAALRRAGFAPWPMQAEYVCGPQLPEHQTRRLLGEVMARGFCPLLYGTPAMSHNPRGMAILSGDTIITKCSLALGLQHIVHLTDVPGLLRDPKDPRSVIPMLSPGSEDQSVTPGGSKNTDVTGGMASKIAPLIAASERGVVSFIVDGKDSEAVGKAMAGEKAGTVVSAADHWGGKS